VPSRLEMLGDRSISSEELLGRSGGLKPRHATDDTRVSGKEEATISIGKPSLPVVLSSDRRDRRGTELDKIAGVQDQF